MKYYTKVLQKVANSSGVTLETVKKEILDSVNEAKKSDNFYTQELWKKCPAQNGEPNAEEVLEFLSNLVIRQNI